MSTLRGEKLAIYLLENVEEELTQEMKDKKKSAFAGNAEAQYQMGMYYNKEGHSKSDSHILAVGVRFMAEAAKRGHAGARAKFQADRQDWRDYC